MKKKKLRTSTNAPEIQKYAVVEQDIESYEVGLDAKNFYLTSSAYCI